MAIITILGAIAIPAYVGYIEEAQVNTARTNANSLRVFLEEYRLENNTYVVDGNIIYDEAQLETHFGWRPDGDQNSYTYLVNVINAGDPANETWDVLVEHISDDTWVRCENRLSSCCYMDTPGATKLACP